MKKAKRPPPEKRKISTPSSDEKSICCVCAEYGVDRSLPYGYHFCEEHLNYWGLSVYVKKAKSERAVKSLHSKYRLHLKRRKSGKIVLKRIELDFWPEYKRLLSPLVWPELLEGDERRDMVVLRAQVRGLLMKMITLQNEEFGRLELMQEKICLYVDPLTGIACGKKAVGTSSYCSKDGRRHRERVKARRHRWRSELSALEKEYKMLKKNIDKYEEKMDQKADELGGEGEEEGAF